MLAGVRCDERRACEGTKILRSRDLSYMKAGGGERRANSPPRRRRYRSREADGVQVAKYVCRASVAADCARTEAKRRNRQSGDWRFQGKAKSTRECGVRLGDAINRREVLRRISQARLTVDLGAFLVCATNGKRKNRHTSLRMTTVGLRSPGSAEATEWGAWFRILGSAARHDPPQNRIASTWPAMERNRRGRT